MTEEQQELFGIERLHIPRSDIPAITHVDYSARVQTVSKERSPDYFDLISNLVSGGQSSTTALKGSTEEAQF